MTIYEVLAEERMREALRQAAHERLVRLAEAARIYRPWYARPLAVLGAWLSALGSGLERRFSESSQPAALLSVRNYR